MMAKVTLRTSVLLTGGFLSCQECMNFIQELGSVWEGRSKLAKAALWLRGCLLLTERKLAFRRTQLRARRVSEDLSRGQDERSRPFRQGTSRVGCDSTQGRSGGGKERVSYGNKTQTTRYQFTSNVPFIFTLARYAALHSSQKLHPCHPQPIVFAVTQLSLVTGRFISLKPSGECSSKAL